MIINIIMMIKQHFNVAHNTFMQSEVEQMLCVINDKSQNWCSV